MSTILDSTRDKVRGFLMDIYGDTAPQIVIELDDTFVIRSGSAAVHLSLSPLGSTDVSVKALAFVVQGARISPELLLHLMRLNARTPFGAFGLMFDDTIIFSHVIAGAHLNRNELEQTLKAVGFIADETDDEIRAVAGGMRAVDANAFVMREAMANKPPRPKIAVPGKPAKKMVKTTVKKAAGKAAAKKPAAKPTPKKAVKKPAPKKPVKKAVKKAVQKTAKKVAKKPVKQIARKPVKKVVKKALPKKTAKKAKR